MDFDSITIYVDFVLLVTNMYLCTREINIYIWMVTGNNKQWLTYSN